MSNREVTLQLEQLEDRVVPAIFFGLNTVPGSEQPTITADTTAGTVRIVGTNGNGTQAFNGADRVQVSTLPDPVTGRGTVLRVGVTYTQAMQNAWPWSTGSYIPRTQSLTQDFRLSSFRDSNPVIVFHGRDGNDTFNNLTSLRSQAWGGFGNDTLIGGSGDDQFHGEVGSDVLQGGLGNDFLAGDFTDGTYIQGGGADTLIGGGGSDYLIGGGGDDTLWGGEENLAASVTDTGDWLVGDYLDNQVVGNDEIHGGSGWDTIYGGEGNDTLFGDGGNDTIIGGRGADLLLGGQGSDTLITGFRSERPANELTLHFVNPAVSNRRFVDPVTGFNLVNPWMVNVSQGLSAGGLDANWNRDTSMDAVNGEQGNDLIFGSRGGDLLVGGTGADTISGAGDSIIVPSNFLTSEGDDGEVDRINAVLGDQVFGVGVNDIVFNLMPLLRR